VRSGGSLSSGLGSPSVALPDRFPARLGAWSRALATVDLAPFLTWLGLALAGSPAPRDSTAAKDFVQLFEDTLPEPYLPLVATGHSLIEEGRKGTHAPESHLYFVFIACLFVQ